MAKDKEPRQCNDDDDDTIMIMTTKVNLFRWQKAKNSGDWRRGDLEEEVESAASITDDNADKDGDDDDNYDEDDDDDDNYDEDDDDIGGYDDVDELIVITKFTFGAIDRVTGTMHFSSLALTFMTDNPRWIGEQNLPAQHKKKNMPQRGETTIVRGIPVEFLLAR